MGSVYPRGNILWLAWVDPRVKDKKGKPKRCLKSSGLPVGQEDEARATLEAIERQVLAEIRQDEEGFSGPPTVAGYARKFIKTRRAAGVGSAGQEEARLRDYVNPFEVEGTTLGQMLLKDVRPHHVRDFVRHLRTLDIAPRTVRHIFGHLRTLFHEAVTDELIAATPCVLKKGVLPKKIDKDPTWRPRAKFSREEVEQLISDERIPLLRRVRYACLFLGSMRIGELSARLWRDVDSGMEPLGRITVNTSYNRKEKRVKSVKTERPREMPVHPTLAKVLAAWKLSGWEQVFGRPPRPDDLLCPSATGGHLKDPVVLRETHGDCVAIGIRPRRTHDSRRTFISLARDNGADKDILRQVTHQPKGDVMDEYSTLSWATLCAEVAKLKIKLLEGKLLALPVAVNSGDGGAQQMTLLQSELQSKPGNGKTLAIGGRLARKSEDGRGGTRSRTPELQGVPTDTSGHQVSGVSVSGVSSTPQGESTARSNVATALSEARAQWVESGDKDALRDALLSLLSELEGGAK